MSVDDELYGDDITNQFNFIQCLPGGDCSTASDVIVYNRTFLTILNLGTTSIKSTLFTHIRDVAVQNNHIYILREKSRFIHLLPSNTGTKNIGYL